MLGYIQQQTVRLIQNLRYSPRKRAAFQRGRQLILLQAAHMIAWKPMIALA